MTTTRVNSADRSLLCELMRESIRRRGRRTFAQFRERWEGSGAFLRFERPHGGIPLSINKNITYGDIFGLWSFWLGAAWPEKPRHLTEMRDSLVFSVSSEARVFDTGAFSERDFSAAESALRKIAGDEASDRAAKRSASMEEYGERQLRDMAPGQRLYEIVTRAAGDTRRVRSLLMSLGFDAVIDTAHVTDEGRYAPAVSAVMLDPRIVTPLDSFSRPA